MELTTVLLANIGLVAIAMTSLWLLSLRLRDASIVDPFWGTGFVIIAWATLLISGSTADRSLLLLSLITVWGLRLSGYLLWRNWGKDEDFRYRAMRGRYGDRFRWISLPLVFGLQGAIMWIVALPVQAGMGSHRDLPLGWLDAAGVLLWALGFVFETVGDWQLARFKSNPINRSRVMDRGLWSWTRHPNYFGDFCVWWGIFLVALSGGDWWTIVSPALMSYLLLKVSGVAMLERTIADRRPEYRDYIRRTSGFFPRPPKPAE